MKKICEKDPNFTVKNKNDLELKYNEIKESINEIGFDETARIYSLSDSKKSGGNLGWIYKNQLSKEIKDELNGLSVGNYTKPIVTSGGFLILKLVLFSIGSLFYTWVDE